MVPAARRRRLAHLCAALRPAAADLYEPEFIKRQADGARAQRAIPLTSASDPDGADRVGLSQASTHAPQLDSMGTPLKDCLCVSG